MTKSWLLFIIINCITSLYLFSQKIKTDTLKVSGNCGMCKTRIERATFIKGVVKADWRLESELLIIQYKPHKVTQSQILEAILGVGHDVEGHKAEDSAYERLPSCCRYRED